MSYIWKSLENHCYCCGQRLGKMTVKDGKIVVSEYSENWGTWIHVPKKSQMETLCRDCQPLVDEKIYKEQIPFIKAVEELKAQSSQKP